jgi:hypothetical protein
MIDWEFVAIAVTGLGLWFVMIWAHWDAQRRANAESLHRIDRLVAAERARAESWPALDGTLHEACEPNSTVEGDALVPVRSRK